MKIQLWPIEKVLPYEQNVKKHPPEQVARIVESIKKAKGFDQPIVVDGAGVIIKGHGRRLAALAMGLKEVPVYVREDLTAEEVRASRLADNRAGLSDIDTAMLRLELADLNLELLKGIFDDKELEFSVTDLGIMNEGAFIDDLDAEVEKQTADTLAKADAMKKAEVPLVKALGFKTIPGEDEIHLSRFMAECERRTGAKGRDAFLAVVREVLAEGVSQS